MVLAELGASLTRALAKLGNVSTVDEKVFDELLRDISNALMKSDVNVRQVVQLRKNVEATVKLEGMASGINQRKVIQKAVFDHLVDLVSSERDPWKPTKGKPNIVMFVGLQGSGKTTTIAKYCSFYKRKGWKVSMVCADTFRAGAFDQLKQNATRIKVPFYGSYTEADPVKLAEDGVRSFLKEGYELIVVDTSGRHKQETALFDEMKEIEASIHPSNVVFVMDSSIGQNAYDQAKAFRDAISIGSVIMTKMDGHAKGGGALSAVSATGAPIIFLGSGEHFDQLEAFEPQSFISRLLGFGDLRGLVKEISDQGIFDPNTESLQRISKGQFTLKDMREQLENIMKLGSVNHLISMIPGLPQGMIQEGKEQEGVDRLKRFIYMMDSMNEKELDGRSKKSLEEKISPLATEPISDRRWIQIARGSGTNSEEVKDLLVYHKSMGKMVGSLGKKNLLSNQGMRNMSRNPAALMQNLSKGIDPRMLNQMGGLQNVMNMMKQFGNSGMGGLGDMAKQFGLGK